MQFPNVYALFRSRTAKYRDRQFFSTRNRGEWRSQTWNNFEEKVHDAACAFLAKGLTKGASVAILAGNVPEWTIIDVAVIAAGGVGVGIYPTSSAEQVEFIVRHSDAEFLIVDRVAQLAKFSAKESEKLKEVVCIEDGTFAEFLNLGHNYRDSFLSKVEALGFGADPNDTAIMVYTSGTTGEPKGAMLSHR